MSLNLLSISFPMPDYHNYLIHQHFHADIDILNTLLVAESNNRAGGYLAHWGCTCGLEVWGGAMMGTNADDVV